MTIIDTLRSRKGKYVTLRGSRQLETYKGVDAVVVKHIKLIGRVGLNYDHMQRTIDGRADGSLPPVNAGLNRMSWDEYPYFLKSNKSGKIYVRLYPVDKDGFRNIETRYTVNGHTAASAAALSLCTAKEKQEHSNPDCINYAIDNITSIS